MMMNDASKGVLLVLIFSVLCGMFCIASCYKEDQETVRAYIREGYSLTTEGKWIKYIIN